MYKPGKENSAVDALSHMTGNPCLTTLYVPQTHVWNNIKKMVV